MKVLITSNSFGTYDEAPRVKMRSMGWEIIDNKYHHIMNEEEMMEEVKDVDAIILGSDIVSKQVLKNANKLKIISRYGVGIDNIDQEEAKKRNIKVTITRNCNTEAVADYTLALMLTLARHVTHVNQALHQGEWKKQCGLDLCHKTVGVFGMGAIGREVIARLEGFGCTIVGYDTCIDEAYCKAHHIEVLEPDAIFKRADIITLHMPGNGIPFISKREISLMKPSCMLINTARASLIHEDDMIKALKQHRIYGYASDVFEGEPYMNPAFRGLDNVVLSPHNAAVSEEAVNKMSHAALEHILTFFENRTR